MSTIRTNTLSNAAGSKSVPVDTVVDGSAKAWVNFNGTGTVAIRAAFNVSSITDNGVGDYTVNFTAAMPDANYSAVVSCGPDAGSPGYRSAYAPFTSNPTASALRMRTGEPASGVSVDIAFVYVAIFR